MVSKISSGVKITVVTFYQPMYSSPMQDEYMFAYKINIENNNPFPVQLLNRYWKIFDSLQGVQIVQGEGVIGEQPTIHSGEHYSYISSCYLHSEIGTMKGKYEMINILTQEKFLVTIPTFVMIVPQKNN